MNFLGSYICLNKIKTEIKSNDMVPIFTAEENETQQPQVSCPCSRSRSWSPDSTSGFLLHIKYSFHDALPFTCLVYVIRNSEICFLTYLEKSFSCYFCVLFY